MLKVYTLGQISLQDGDTSLSGFVSQKAEVLFVYLLLHPRIHQRDMIASLFWGDTTGEQAMKNLRTALSSLQKQLADYLIADRQTLTVNPDMDIWLDVRAFESDLGKFVSRDQDLSHKPPRSVLTRFSEVVDLYKGDFLSGFRPGHSPELDSWMSLERERLRRRAIEALGVLIDYLTDWGEVSVAIQQTYRLLALDPLSEVGIRRLIRLLAYSGDRNAAIRQFNDFKKQLYAELEVEPEPETLALFEQVKSGRLRPIPTIAPTDNLPANSQTFIERPYESAQITQNLDRTETRIVTLVGVGGAGKTSLALQSTRERRGEYQNGIYYVPLASIDSSDMIAPRVLSSLPMRKSSGDSREQLLDYLRDKHMLLLLDNFEHILDGAPLVADIIQAAPNVKILATSREPLGLRAEQVVRLDGLSLPERHDDGSLNEDQARFSAAVRLFEQTARRVQPDFDLDRHLHAVVRICFLVDGLPLGIEIAAAHVPIMAPEQIEDHLDSLKNVHRDVPERHGGIRNLLDDIWRYLNDDEKRVLRRFAIFPGDFSLDAALSIGETTANVLVSLINKSLLQKRGDRYDLHQIVWRYLLEKLENANERDQAAAAHANFYRAWLEPLDKEATGPRHDRFSAIDQEYHNLWSGLTNSETAQRLYYTVALSNYWSIRGFHFHECIDLLQDLTQTPVDDHQLYTRALMRLGVMHFNLGAYDDARQALKASTDAGIDRYPRYHALALNTLVQLHFQTGDYEEGRDLVDQIMTIYDNAEDQSSYEMQLTRLLAHHMMCYASVEMGDYETAQQHGMIGVELARDLNELHDLASLLNNLGLVALKVDDDSLAYRYYSEALDIAREIDHRNYIAIFTGNLAGACLSLERYDEGVLLTLEAVELAQQLDFKIMLPFILDNLITAMKGTERFACAATLYGAQFRLRDVLGTPVVARDRDFHQERLDILRKKLGDAEFEKHFASGQDLGFNDAVDFAQRCYFGG